MMTFFMDGEEYKHKTQTKCSLGMHGSQENLSLIEANKKFFHKWKKPAKERREQIFLCVNSGALWANTI